MPQIAGLRRKVALACTVCYTRNYSVSKPIGSAKRMELNKFCPVCNKHTVHAETR